MSSAQQPARLILRTYDGETLREYSLDKPITTIGRASTRDISVPQDKLISRRHASVNIQGNTYVLQDEGSVNGTFVNGQALHAKTPYMLQDGDQIGIGNLLLIFQTTSLEIETSPSAQGAILTQQQVEQVEDQNIPLAAIPTPASQTHSAEPASPPPSSGFTEPLRPLSTRNMRFTLFHPRVIAANEWYTLLVYAHTEKALQEVRDDAATFESEGQNTPLNKIDPVIQQLLCDTPVTLIPECEGVLFNPRRITFKWRENWHRAEFHISARHEHVHAHPTGRVDIFVGPLLVATLPLTLQVGEQGMPLEEDNQELTVPLYKRIFPSYSPADTSVAQACRSVYRSLGINTFMDIDTMRTSEGLSSGLKQVIEEAEVFQLFWSARASKSPLVLREWDYALTLHREKDFIRPMYWDVPFIKPPERLASLHFTYLPMYIFSRTNTS